MYFLGGACNGLYFCFSQLPQIGLVKKGHTLRVTEWIESSQLPGVLVF